MIVHRYLLSYDHASLLKASVGAKRTSRVRPAKSPKQKTPACDEGGPGPGALGMGVDDDEDAGEASAFEDEEAAPLEEWLAELIDDDDGGDHIDGAGGGEFDEDACLSEDDCETLDLSAVEVGNPKACEWFD